MRLSFTFSTGKWHLWYRARTPGRDEEEQDGAKLATEQLTEGYRRNVTDCCAFGVRYQQAVVLFSKEEGELFLHRGGKRRGHSKDGEARKAQPLQSGAEEDGR